MPLFEGLGSGGEKTAVVIDLGAAYTKCGFAGETGPRFIIPSELQKPGQQQSIKVVQYNINTEELYSNLKEFIHMLYFRHLLVNPRDRRVLIIESILCPSHFRETLTKVFFKQFEVPSVLFAPSHLMSIMSLGINSGLVMDCGYTETLVLPVYECIPILSAWEALPLGGKAIHKELDGLLVEQCTVDSDSSTGQSLPTVIGSIPEEVVEDIKVRTCFVSDLKRGLKIQEAKFNLEGTAERPTPPPDVDYPLDGEKILHIKGPIRDSVMEMLFEQDNEEKSVATLVLDTLVKERSLEHCKTSWVVALCRATTTTRQAVSPTGAVSAPRCQNQSMMQGRPPHHS
ncbi:actin-related protein 10 isoform X2 [Salmo salar]|uniref:Actin-related protein 10 n=1 Tax=Salmo salar TaxID=8030 RepID=A0A1S3SAA7_SALSA|nr:actin-related protein 10 isoform X2 [Salmo salar]|eukprot:XP_014061267.1 PREDICTED: actin-related protein 10-like isoform X2 [Salmo salar]